MSEPEDGPPRQGDTVYVQWSDESGRPVLAASGVWRAHPSGGARLYLPDGDEDYPKSIDGPRTTVTVYDRADEYMRFVELAGLALASHDELGGGMTDSPAWYVRSGAAAVAVAPVWEALQVERRTYAERSRLDGELIQEVRSDQERWKDACDRERRLRTEGVFGRVELETLAEALWLPLHPQDGKAVATIADAVRTRHRRLCEAAGVPVDTSPPVLAGHVRRLAKSAQWQDERTRERLDVFRHALADAVGVGRDRSWEDLSRTVARLVDDRAKSDGYRSQLAQEIGISGDSTWAEVDRGIARLVDDRAELVKVRSERDEALWTVHCVRDEIAGIRMTPTEVASITVGDPVKAIRRLGEQFRVLRERDGMRARERTPAGPSVEHWEGLREALGLSEDAPPALVVAKAREAAEAVQSAADRAEAYEGAARVAGAEYTRVWSVANKLLAWHRRGVAPSPGDLDAVAREIDPYAKPPSPDDVPTPARGFLFALSPDARRHAFYNGSTGAWFEVVDNPRGRFVSWTDVQDWTVFAPGRTAVVPEKVGDRVERPASTPWTRGSTPSGVMPDDGPAPDLRPSLPSALWDLAREWSTSAPGVSSEAELDEGRAVKLSDVIRESVVHETRQEAGRELSRVLEAVARSPHAAHEPQRVWYWGDEGDRLDNPECPVVDDHGVLWGRSDRDGLYHPHYANGLPRSWATLLKDSGRLLEVVDYFTPPVGWGNRVDEVLWFQGLRDEQYRDTSWALSNLVRSWIGTWAHDVDSAPAGDHWGPRTQAAQELEVEEIGAVPERFRWHRPWSRVVDAERFEALCHDCEWRRIGVGPAWAVGELRRHAREAEPVLVDSTKPQVFTREDPEPHESVTVVRSANGTVSVRVPVGPGAVPESDPKVRVAWRWRAGPSGPLTRWRDLMARSGWLVEMIGHGKGD